MSSSRLNKVALSLAVVAGFASSPVLAQGKEPLRIGIPTAVSGPYASVGLEAKRAGEFAAAEANAKGGVDGRKVELKVLDTETKPDIARRQAEKLALEGYKILTGTITSGEVLAIGPMLERWDAVFLSTTAKSSRLTGDSCAARLFRVTQADYHDLAVISPWLATRKERKWAIVAVDYTQGREIAKNFREAALAGGKQVVSEYYPALGTNDYAPYIQQLKNAAPDGVFAMLGGRDAINFMTQAKQFGLLDSIVLAGVSITLDSSVKVVGATANGVWGNINYGAGIDTPENKAFVAAWRKFYNGDEPTDIEGQNYVAYQAIFQAVERSHSVKPSEVAQALSGGSFDTLFGKASIRAADNQMMLPNYFGYVASEGGKMKKVVTLSVPADKATPALDGSCKMSKL